MNTARDRLHPHRVAAVRRRSYVAAPLTAAVLGAIALVAACAAGTGQGEPVDPQAAERLVATTRPTRRVQVVFDWSLSDRDARFNGRGVLRLDPPYRARLDLFGPRGETLAAAVVEEEVMRIVPAGAEGLLPPPALLWSTLGVYRQPEPPLTGAVRDGDRLTLEHTRDRTRWRFRFENDALRGTEWTDGSGRRTVELSGTSSFGLPREAVFRDWTEFRELTLRVTGVEEKSAFESDVWVLPGER